MKHGTCFAIAVLVSGISLGSQAIGATKRAPRTKPLVTTPTTSTLQFFDNSKGSPLVPLIQAAKSSLDIEIYEMEDAQVLDELSRAVDRGVHVRVVQEPEPLGGKCSLFGQGAPSAMASTCRAQRALVQKVIQAGGTYVPFHKAALCGGGTEASTLSCFEHGKIVVADAAQALISTGNFNATNLCDAAEHPETCNRDFTILTSDAAVASALQAIVANDALGKAYDVQAVMKQAGGQDIGTKLTVSPFSLEPLVQFIRSAKTRIQVENQYLKEPTLNQELEAAAKRGVRVEIMVASACAFGPPQEFETKQWNQIFGAFDSSGIHTEIFNRLMKVNGANGYLHAKAILVDDSRAWVGSVNGSSESTSRNREYGIFFTDAEQVSKLGAVLSADFVSPERESWEDSLRCAEGTP